MVGTQDSCKYKKIWSNKLVHLSDIYKSIQAHKLIYQILPNLKES